DPLGERLGVERRERLVEPKHQDVLHPALLQELEPALESREQLHLNAEERARMGVERHDRLTEPRRGGGLQHPLVAAVHAVECPDRDAARLDCEAVAGEGDVHAVVPTRASASASGSRLRGSNASGVTASSANGPTSVRRSETQSPPRASAIARTYVPLLTWRSSVTEPPVYAMTSSAYTVDRRTGISTAMPFRASR